MFRIRKVPDDLYAMNRHAVDQVKQILKARFESLSEEKIQAVTEQLHDPLKFRFRSLLFVAESQSARVQGFALLMHAPDHGFCFLDYIATRPKDVSSGIGGALYMRCREEARLLNVSGIYMEALPDDPGLCPGPQMQAQNRARLKFWERFGVRPIINTLYETPVKPGDTCPPYLLLDSLDQGQLPSAQQARDAAEAILRRKYGDYCPEEYIRRVSASFNDDPVMLRPFRYIKEVAPLHPVERPETRQIILVYNQSHAIHHIRERGYVESPVRIRNVLKGLDTSALFRKVDPVSFPEKHIREVHTPGMIAFLKQVSAATPAGTLVYPYIFPVRNPQRRPKELPLLAGYYCMDTFTPIHHHLWEVATDAVDCALTGAGYLLEDYPVAYALVRPPGHHAEANIYGGFCYLNSAAIAANYLSKYGKVAILDVDYHHGNGQQEIFYKRSDVLTVSLHGTPANTYPYFCGYRDEKGEGEGLGYNHNFPVKEQATPDDYRQVLADALKVIKKFDPAFLVICFGLDLAKGDPTGTFSFQSKDFERNGRMIGALKKPMLVVQEGGYNTSSLGINALRFMEGLHHGLTNRQ